jgi:hypothetical protein
MIQVHFEVLNLIIQALTPYLKKGSIAEKDLYKITYLLDKFIKIMPYPNYSFIPTRLIRASINSKIPNVGNNIIKEIKYLKYPPSGNVIKFGRCNTIKMPILYGAFSKLTATKELRPNTHEIVTFSEWEPSNEIPFKAFPIFFIDKDFENVYNGISLDVKKLHENYISKMSQNEQTYYNLSMQFLAMCFSKEVEINNHFDYFMSSYISNNIFSNLNESYDLILYPSVEERLGFSNMAFRPETFDQRFILKEVTTDLCLGIKGTDLKGVMFKQICNTTNFDLEVGSIKWDKVL